MRQPFSRVQIATAIAILFHAVGLFGIFYLPRTSFLQTTPLNLLLMFGLLLYTQPRINRWYWIFFGLCFATGMIVEWVGVHTGYLFGHYQYGAALGPAIDGIPWMIGVNWFIVVLCCGSFMQYLIEKITLVSSQAMQRRRPAIKALSIMVDGATLAVAFDWLMEPVAVKLGYWQWLGNGEIPLYNYICWFVISLPLLYFFQRLPFYRPNKFALHLLLIQALFFLILRSFL